MTRKVGVEEEFFLVDPATRRLAAVAAEAIRAGHLTEDPPVEHELFLQQIETQTSPCSTAGDLETELRRGRHQVRDRAGEAGALVLPVATPVLEQPPGQFTPLPRYRRIAETYGELARQSVVCAMHVHIEIADEHEGVAVLDRIRPWLPCILAISANSPYWWGQDTGHASWRSQIWARWPTAGPHDVYGDVGTYREHANAMQAWGGAMDDGMLYFDARLSEGNPTVEIRVADVCANRDDARLVALLTRGLVETAVRSWRAGSPPQGWPTELLRVAAWQAAKNGSTSVLVSPDSRELAPSRDVLAQLTAHVRKSLEYLGDAERVGMLLADHLGRGDGATLQRASRARHGDLCGVIDELAL